MQSLIVSHCFILVYFITKKKKVLIGLSRDPIPATVSLTHRTVHHSCKWRGCKQWDGTTQLLPESTELLNKKVKGKPEFLQSEKQEWRRTGPWPFDGKQSSAFRKHKEMRMGRRGGTLTNLVGGREAIMGLIRNQRGSVQRVKLVFSIWKLIFASHSGHLCLFVSQIYTAPWWEYGRFYTVVTRRDDQRVRGISASRENMWERWVVLPLTMPQCAVYKRMSMSEGAGRGRAAFLSLEPGYPLPCPRLRWHVPCICSLVIACPLTPEIKTVRMAKIATRENKAFVT